MNDHSYKDYYSVNCPSVICSPHCYAFERVASSEPMAPGSFLKLNSSKTNIALAMFAFILLCNFHLSLSFNLVTSKTRGLTTLLPSWVQANSLFVSRCC